MAHKQLLFRNEARTELLRGASTLADAVRITLGPRSKSVLIAKKWGAALVCNDGLTTAKELELEDPVEDLGARTERTGLKLLARAREAPTRTIADNSGADDGVVIERMRAGAGNTGFDAARGVYCDLVEAGVIDPTKVVRMALENAVSAAGVLLLSEATMTEVPEAAVTRTQEDMAS